MLRRADHSMNSKNRDRNRNRRRRLFCESLEDRRLLATINVAAGDSIQDALDAAAPGDTVEVAPGTFAENLLITKPVTLNGANVGLAGNDPGRGPESIVDPSIEFGIEVRADDVTIDGFEITDIRRDAINVRPTNSGPGIATRDNIVIQNNHIHDDLGPINQVNGILFGESHTGESTDDATISNVTIANNLIDVDDDGLARGIVMTGQFSTILFDGFDVTGNTIHATGNGLVASEIATQYTADSIAIVNNHFESPGSTAVNIGNLDSASQVNGNTFIDNGFGAAVNFRQAGGEIIGNSFENHSGAGIFFYDGGDFPQSSEDATVTGNTFNDNFIQVGAPALAVDLDSIPSGNTLDGGVRVSSNRFLWGGIQDAIDNALPGDTVTVVVTTTYSEDVDVNQAVTLAGEPTIDGTLTASVAGATLSAGTSPGVITSGSLTLTSGSILDVEINGDTLPGTDYDQLVVNGTVNLGGATLQTSGTLAATSVPIVLVDNDSGDAVVGTFDGLPEGSLIDVNGQTLVLSYMGGDGNDVVLDALTLGFPPIIDNSDADGFRQFGPWTTINRNGHQGGFLIAKSGTGSTTANWSFDVPPGQYRVAAAWRAWVNRATDAPYTVFDNTTPLATIDVNQQLAPVGLVSAGTKFLPLGIFDITSGPLQVELTNDANGFVSADAIFVEAIGAAEPEIEVTLAGAVINDGASTVDFGHAQLGATVTRTFTVENLGDDDLNLTEPIATPTGFSVVSSFGATTLAPGASTTFEIAIDTGSLGPVAAGDIVFGTNDSDEDPFNFTVKGNVVPVSDVQIVDNGGFGYTTKGSFATVNRNGFANDFDYALSKTGNNVASWTFNVEAGETYRVAAAWRAFGNRATDATYNMIDGFIGPTLGSTQVNQQVTPDPDFVEGPGIFNRFQILADVTVSGNVLVVQLSDAANGLVVADAIRIERL